MARFQIITLVDITQTNPHRSETDSHLLAQQANFNSLVQAIGLRSNISWIKDPTMHTGALPANIAGKAKHWVWEFDCEREDVFLKGADPVGLLADDLHNVPIIDQLKNSVDLAPAAFQTKGPNINSWLSIVI